MPQNSVDSQSVSFAFNFESLLIAEWAGCVFVSDPLWGHCQLFEYLLGLWAHTTIAQIADLCTGTPQIFPATSLLRLQKKRCVTLEEYRDCTQGLFCTGQEPL